MDERPAVDPFGSAVDLAASIADGSASSLTSVEGYLERIDRLDDELNAFVTVRADGARAEAAEADDAVSAGQPTGPLHGVSIAIKDLGDLKAGMRHTFGSSIIDALGFEADRTSVHVARLEEAGAIVLGSTNTPAFGHLGVTINDHVGPTANPLDPSQNAGGSSGGSAAAVAAGLVATAIGSDAGGSVRIPAAACGVVGHKPSFGLIPVDTRPNAFGRSMHHSVRGPIARTVEDAAVVLDVLTGAHPRDPASVPVDIDARAATERDIDGLRIGYSSDLEVFPVEAAVEQPVEAGLEGLEAAGAVVEPVTVDHGRSLEALAETVSKTFAATLVGTNATLAESFGIDLRDHPAAVPDSLLAMLELGDATSIGEVAATGITRTAMFDAVQDVFDRYDLLATPTVATQELPLESTRGSDWELALTWPFNWTGHPAASVPVVDGDRWAGLQLIAPPYQDERIFAAAAALERTRPWHSLYDRVSQVRSG